MSPSQSVSLSEDDRISLVSLVNSLVNSPDVRKLESMLSEFNLFHAIGVGRQELTHSHLLSFLLAPNETHGLRDQFLKDVISNTFAHIEGSPLHASEIDSADLSDVEVRKEWRHIDILIISHSNRWVIAIENKVDSGEHSNQLCRYRGVIEAEFAGYEKKAFVYLTKEGDDASCPEWRSLSYRTVADTLENIAAEQHSSISGDIHVLISHYISLIRRYIVSDSEIAQLCQKIYRQHHQAINLIYSHRLDRQVEIADFLKTLIGEEERLEQEESNKFFIRFVPKAWDASPFQKTCDAQWTDSKRLVMFEFFNYPDRLEFKLTVGPGIETDKVAIHNVVKGLNLPGAINTYLKPDKWSPLFCQTVITSTDYFEKDRQGIQEQIREFWQRFLNREMEKITSAFTEIQALAT